MTESNNLAGAVTRLAIMQAVHSAVAEQCNRNGTKDGGDNARTVVDRLMADAFTKNGIKSVDARVNGEKVGTVSVTTTKAVDETTPEVIDGGAFVEWLRSTDDGLATLQRAVAVKPDLMAAWATADGVVPDGVRYTKRHKPERMRGTVVNVNRERVAAALGNQLPETMSKLLVGEVE